MTSVMGVKVAVCSSMKSGTWLLREIVTQLTGLRAYEPNIPAGRPRYDDAESLIFPPDSFFSWHLLPTGGRLAANALLSNPLRTAATAASLTIGLSVVVVNSFAQVWVVSVAEIVVCWALVGGTLHAALRAAILEWARDAA